MSKGYKEFERRTWGVRTFKNCTAFNSTGNFSQHFSLLGNNYESFFVGFKIPDKVIIGKPDSEFLRDEFILSQPHEFHKIIWNDIKNVFKKLRLIK